MNAASIRSTYLEQFAVNPEIIVRAPGRVNLIGEHTDYNGGFVMPAAIDKSIWLAAGKRDDEQLVFYAADLGEGFRSDDGSAVFQEKLRWANYLLGVISEARKDGLFPGGMNVAFGGDVPLGAGLSSSAALESGMMFLMNELFRFGLSKMDLVRLAQRGENNFVGMKCGIMDMFASVMSLENRVVRLDCRSLEFSYFPFEMPGYTLVLFDSGVKHALVDSEYNTRRAECESGVEILCGFHPGIESLRDVSSAMLETHKEDLPEVVYRRCKYVVEENARVLGACDALQRNNARLLGELMYETHRGLDEDYQVSVPEINFLVETARKAGVAGARMMGGGFGGCTINLIREEHMQPLLEKIRRAYLDAFAIELRVYPVRLTSGTEAVL